MNDKNFPHKALEVLEKCVSRFVFTFKDEHYTNCLQPRGDGIGTTAI